MNAASDAELVARCRAGDEAAWEALVDRYARYVYAIAARVYRLGPQDAEDVFQEVFSRVFERLGSLRESDALRPWIAQTTRHCAIDALRRSGREIAVDEIPDAADEGLARLDEALTVHAALDGLSAGLSRDPRPVLLPRRELPHDLRRARASVGDDREQDRPLPHTATGRARTGKKLAASPVG